MPREYTARLGTSATDGTTNDITLDNCPEIDSIQGAAYIDVGNANTAITQLTPKATKADINGDDQIAPISGGVCIRPSAPALVADDILMMTSNIVGERVKVS